MEQQALEIIFKQLPIIVFMAIVQYFSYKYFVKEAEKRELFFTKEGEKREIFFKAELDKRDSVILHKDEEIKELNLKLVDLTSKCLDQSNRNNELIAGLRSMLERFLNDKK